MVPAGSTAVPIGSTSVAAGAGRGADAGGGAVRIPDGDREGAEDGDGCGASGVMPGDDGGCEWNPAAFSPRTKFIYYGTRYEPTTFQTHSGNRTLINGLHLGSTFVNRVPDSHPFGIFGATNTRTGRIAWRIEVPLPAKSGVTVA